MAGSDKKALAVLLVAVGVAVVLLAQRAEANVEVHPDWAWFHGWWYKILQLLNKIPWGIDLKNPPSYMWMRGCFRDCFWFMKHNWNLENNWLGTVNNSMRCWAICEYYDFSDTLFPPAPNNWPPGPLKYSSISSAATTEQERA